MPVCDDGATERYEILSGAARTPPQHWYQSQMVTSIIHAQMFLIVALEVYVPTWSRFLKQLSNYFLNIEIYERRRGMVNR
jgi:hypothetical protein